jgi:ATP-binding protein involved in chromosome partitioning
MILSKAVIITILPDVVIFEIMRSKALQRYEPPQRARIDQVGAVLVVGSGKGGVGKSTVSVNLAVALAKQGAAVGLLDGDAYGPSVPMMLGVRKRRAGQGAEVILPLAQRGKLTPEQMLKPLLRYGIKVMSVGFFIGEEQAVAPVPDVLGMLIRQLLYSVNWGSLDYLIIDLPPGNGEPQATLCREMHLDGAILVTTPQDIARIDTAKALAMFQGVDVPVLGVVQNMDGFLCPHCSERVEIFPHSREARELLDELPLLGSIPLDPSTAMSGDKGQPVVVSKPESPVSKAFIGMALQVAAILETRRRSQTPPTNKEEAGILEKGDVTNDEGED